MILCRIFMMNNLDIAKPAELPIEGQKVKHSALKKVFSKDGLIIATLFVWLTFGLFGYFVLQILKDNTEDLQVRIGALEENVKLFYTQVTTGDIPLEKLGDNEFRKVIPYLINEVKRLNALTSTSTPK